MPDFSKFLTYDPDTGHLMWKISRGTVRKGAVAGSLQTRGYLQVRIEGKSYLAHRIAWLLHFGSMPIHQVDHINGVRTDNRIVNLRATDSSTSQANRTPAPRRGRVISKKGTRKIGRDRWAAQITVHGTVHRLGDRFPTTEAAHAAYIAAARLHFGEFARPD